MKTKPCFKLSPIWCALLMTAIAQNSYALAANFRIQPVGTLPTTVPVNGNVLANFALTNVSNTARNGYLVRGFPATVTQITNGPGNCTSPINLPAGAQCNLQFRVSGAVNSSFAICKGS